MKLNLFICLFVFETPLKIFDSIHLFYLLFGLDTYKHIKESSMYLSSQRFFKTPHKALKFQVKS